MSTTPAPTGLKYSDYTQIGTFATASITTASLTGILNAPLATEAGASFALVTTILTLITAYLRSKGD
jgi:hypothetical protein